MVSVSIFIFQIDKSVHTRTPTYTVFPYDVCMRVPLTVYTSGAALSVSSNGTKGMALSFFWISSIVWVYLRMYTSAPSTACTADPNLKHE